MKKLLSILLVLVMVMSLLAGCLPENPTPTTEPTTTEPIVETTDPADVQDEPVHPALIYNLDQSMIDNFYKLLQESEDIALSGQTWEEVDAKTNELDDAYMLLIDQNQIAYVLYCIDQSNETLSQQYLDTTDIVTQAELDYNDMIRRIYLSDTPYKEQLFEDWTQQDIDRMLRHNEEIAELEKRNAEITLEYRELKEATKSIEMIPLYNELVRNNNRIAQIYGYDNYYEFAYAEIYDRDYDLKQLRQMRTLVSKYMPAIYTKAIDRFYANLQMITDDELDFLNELLFTGYKDLPEDYVQMYLAALPESLRAGMIHMFDNNRVYFSDSEDSYDGAFTTWIGEEPFCYYGPNYQSNDTIVHELGHYYGGLHSESWSLPMDICETQSQGNEWLYIYYMRNNMSKPLHDVLVDYRLVNDIGNIIAFVMIDAFEEKVYTHKDAGNLTLEQYEDLMDQVAEDYGGMAFVEENIGDLQGYWKLVVLESPVYYISYAVSAVASINLFTIAQNDEAAAWECYRKLVEDVEEDQGFLWNIREAGLAGPFDETVYKDLAKRFGVR